MPVFPISRVNSIDIVGEPGFEPGIQKIQNFAFYLEII